jgi:hypothetical protein
MIKLPAATRWTARERRVLARLVDPAAIQDYLDHLVYSDDPFYRCPRSVMRDRKAHCMDGALFAAHALWRLGHAPLLVDLRAERDDDHVVAVFRSGRHWGAVAKSNFAGLRFREPIYRSVRELAMSYFELYYNLEREKTLRACSIPVDLRKVEVDWTHADDAVEHVVTRLDASRHSSLVSRAMVNRLLPVDPRSYGAGLAGANQAGLYRPGKG